MNNNALHEGAIPNVKLSPLAVGIALSLLATTIAASLAAKDLQTSAQRSGGSPRAVPARGSSTDVVINGREVTPQRP